MPDTLLHEKIAQEVHEAGNAGRKARADSEAESRENEKTGTLISPSLITGIRDKTNFKKCVSEDGTEVTCKFVGRDGLTGTPAQKVADLDAEETRRKEKEVSGGAEHGKEEGGDKKDT